ncbi:hypothetical protein [Legionella spiritensis]|uniref:Uncharacterized protein n=1 Tax=Legionella spiritensis TaxID=452 RepID=A0A0W0YYE4_LEGSP|nr:hypothetical protein [Legionella spiritensis]KTD61892.1 hypothetical protein Lspi_2522 [Legionella spiritensis]SNV31244.1 Uncharacterised protein [Legionella spiritensis]
MTELNNRVNAQRQILKIINSKQWQHEPLISLSHKAIERWINKNSIPYESELASIIYKASEGLFALANKSQEHISDEYLKLSKKVKDMMREIEIELEKHQLGGRG